MATYPQIPTKVPITLDGSVPSAGDEVTFQVRLQPRHLARVNICSKITVSPGAGPGYAITPTQDGDSLDGVLSRVRVNVNDQATGRRTAIDAQGSSLIAWAARKGVPMDRFTKLAIKPTGGASGDQTHYVKTPILFQDPTLPDTVSPVTALPLYDAGKRATLNEPVEFKLTFGAANFGLAAGTAAIAEVWAEIFYLDNVGPAVPYVPKSLLQHEWKFYAAGNAEPLDIERDGYLASLMFDAYRNAGLTLGGSCLASGGLIRVKQDRLDLDEFDLVRAIQADDEYDSGASYIASASGIPRSQIAYTFMRDYLHTGPGVAGNTPYSMPNLWAKRSAVQLLGENVSASTGFKVLVDKFLAPDGGLNVLAGV